MKVRGAAIVVAVWMGWAGTAAAAPGLGDQVEGLHIEKGLTEVEAFAGQITGGANDGEAAASIEVEHSFSDRFRAALRTEVEKEPGQDATLDSFGLEGVVRLGRIPGLGVNAGLYVEYEQRLHGESGVLEAKAILTKHTERFLGKLNLIARRPLHSGPDDTVRWGYAASAEWQAFDDVTLGAEAFGDLSADEDFGGRQGHFVGPTVAWDIGRFTGAKELAIRGGYLFPIGSARQFSDGQVRLGIEWEHRF